MYNYVERMRKLKIPKKVTATKNFVQTLTNQRNGLQAKSIIDLAKPVTEYNTSSVGIPEGTIGAKFVEFKAAVQLR